MQSLEPIRSTFHCSSLSYQFIELGIAVFAVIISGSVVIEKIFLVPGLGTFFVQSALNRDYTLIMGTVVMYSIILILMNFVVDILYAVIDPRISYK